MLCLAIAMAESISFIGLLRNILVGADRNHYSSFRFLNYSNLTLSDMRRSIKRAAFTALALRAEGTIRVTTVSAETNSGITYQESLRQSLSIGLDQALVSGAGNLPTNTQTFQGLGRKGTMLGPVPSISSGVG